MLDRQLPSFGSENESLISDDAMSWQADEEVTKNATAHSEKCILFPSDSRGSLAGAETIYPTAESSAEASERRWAAERDTVKRQIEAVNTSQVIVINSDDDATTDQNPDDDEDFGLLLGTLNSTSPISQLQDKRQGLHDQKQRRSKIPDPWRHNSRRIVHNDELSRLSSPPRATKASLAKQLVKELTEESVDMDLSEYIIPQKASFQTSRQRKRKFGSLCSPGVVTQ